MRTFLTAEWRHLLMLNYAVDPAVLLPHMPEGVELDTFNNITYVSMVGFLFLRTRVLGVPIPGHINFEEVNLRFYVRRRASEGWRRGVVFIKEIVPRRLIATVARACYDEPYITLPMRHAIDLDHGALRTGSTIEYSWLHQGRWNSLRATATGEPHPITEGSVEEFITEHYWGYTARKNGTCSEYRVEHARWKVWNTQSASLDCDVATLYGKEFAAPLKDPSQSAFIAEGSPVSVSTGNRLPLAG